MDAIFKKCKPRFWKNFTPLRAALIIICHQLYWNKSLVKGKLSVNFTLCYHVAFELRLSYGCMSGPLGDSVHGAYFIVCPVCKDRTGCDREGKETQHSFKELDLLGENNSHGIKTRMKITTGCSGTQEGYSSFISGCFMFILGNAEETRSLFIIPFIVWDSFDFHT